QGGRHDRRNRRRGRRDHPPPRASSRAAAGGDRAGRPRGARGRRLSVRRADLDRIHAVLLRPAHAWAGSRQALSRQRGGRRGGQCADVDCAKRRDEQRARWWRGLGRRRRRRGRRRLLGRRRQLRRRRRERELVMRRYLTADDHKRVSDAVALAESHTAGEIVTVVADRSDGYSDVAFAWAALASFTALALFALFPGFYLGLIESMLGGWNHEWTNREVLGVATAIAIVKFLAVWAILHWQPLRFFLVPPPIKTARALARAIDLFKVGA